MSIEIGVRQGNTSVVLHSPLGEKYSISHNNQSFWVYFKFTRSETIHVYIDKDSSLGIYLREALVTYNESLIRDLLFKHLLQSLTPVQFLQIIQDIKDCSFEEGKESFKQSVKDLFN